MKTRMILGVLIATFILGGVIFAQPKGKMNMHEKLKLTEQQQSKIETLKSEHLKKMVDLKADLEKNHIEMRDLQSKGNYSRSDFLAMVDKISKTRDQIAKEMANHRMDVYEQLTPEQKKIFNEMPMGMGREGDGPRGKGMHRKGMGKGDMDGMGNMMEFN